MNKAIVRLLAATVVLVTWRLPARAQVCGGTIITPTVMTGDLSCGLSPAITIAAGGSLDMNGFTLTCTASNEGILITGGGATVSNGRITGCTNSVHLTLNGGNTIRRILSSSSSAKGFLSDAGTKNKYINNVVRAAGGTCFDLAGGGQKLIGNLADGCGGSGIVASGEGGALTDNIVRNAGATIGIDVGSSSKLTRNVVDGDNGLGTYTTVTGIRTGVGCKLSGNVVTHTTINAFQLGAGAKASKNRAANNSGGGFIATGGPKLMKNVAANNTGNGFNVSNGSGAKLKANKAVKNAIGIYIGSIACSDYSVSDNLAMGNNNGIEVGTDAIDTTISKNVAIGNTNRDLKDDSSSCGSSTWEDNVYSTRFQGCED